MEFWLAYLATGLFAGILAGLLGVGGGLVIVPVLALIFAAQQFPATHIMHLALGTSLASILFTSVSSLRAHHALGAVDWRVVRGISPGIIFGTLLGSLVAAQLSALFLKVFFIVFIYYVAVQMLLDIKPKPSRQLPGAVGLFAAGGVIGGVSSLVGIGGGTLTVPFMTWCNLKLHHAIGTSAAIGFPIAAAGALGFVLNGTLAQGLPQYSWGYVHLPALAGLVLGSVTTAPFGAKLAHRLPVALLKKIFAALLLVLGTRMLVSW
ncbi:MAG: sulfite exporter TauE/SafE family protein [Sulfuricellaceae bacterium]